MANHTGRSAQQTPKQPDPPPPVLRWGTIVKIDDYHWALATMATQGQKIIEQKVGKPDARHIVEAEFQTWSAVNVLDRGDV